MKRDAFAFHMAGQVNRQLLVLSDAIDKKAKSLPDSDRGSFLDAVLVAITGAWNKAVPQRPFTPTSLKRHVGGNLYQWADEPGKAIRLLFHDMNHMFMSESFERFLPTISSEDGSRSFHTYIHEAANAFLEYGVGSSRIDSFVGMATRVISNQADEWLHRKHGPYWDRIVSHTQFSETCAEVLAKEVRDYHITAGNDAFMAGMVGLFRKLLLVWGHSVGVGSVNRVAAAMVSAVVPLLKKAVNALAEKHSDTRVDMDAYQEYLNTLTQGVRKVIAMGPRTASVFDSLESTYDIRKGWFAIISGGEPDELLRALNASVVRNVPPPTQVPKFRGAVRAYSFHWSNAQAKWDVLGAREFPWGTDGAEFILFVGSKALSPNGKPWNIFQMKEIAKRLNKHPGFAMSPESRRAAITPDMVARVAAKALAQPGSIR